MFGGGKIINIDCEQEKKKRDEERVKKDQEEREKVEKDLNDLKESMKEGSEKK